MTVGLIGLGRMGMAICERLGQYGLALRAYDQRETLEPAATAAGAQWVRSASAAAAADLLLTVLPAAEDVALVAETVVPALRPGTIWVDMSTGTPALARQLTERHGPALRLVDAPIAGNPSDVGSLLTFVGGDVEDVELVRPVLAILTDRVIHVGAHGTGYVLKLLTNLLWFEQAVATAEAMCLAERSGISAETLRDAVAQSAAASQFIAVDAERLLEGDILASYPLARCHEQLRAVLALGAELRVPLGLASATTEIHARARERYGDVDGELLGARLVADEAGVDLRRQRAGVSRACRRCM